MFINFTSIRGLISRLHKELCATNLQIIQSLMRSQTEQNVSRMKSFYTPLAIGELSTKITLRFYFMNSQKSPLRNKGQAVLARMPGKRRSHDTWTVGMEIGRSTMEISIRAFQKIKNITVMVQPYHSSV